MACIPHRLDIFPASYNYRRRRGCGRVPVKSAEECGSCLEYGTQSSVRVGNEFWLACLFHL
jgi:hypothetical protein